MFFLDPTLWISENQYLVIEHRDGQAAEALVEEQTRTCPPVSRTPGQWGGGEEGELEFSKGGL